jgi:hypothetical protein
MFFLFNLIHFYFDNYIEIYNSLFKMHNVLNYLNYLNYRLIEFYNYFYYIIKIHMSLIL